MAVSFSADEGIGVVTLDKPPANSYDLAFIEELAEAVRETRRPTMPSRSSWSAAPPSGSSPQAPT